MPACPAAARSQVKFSARRLAELRRWCSGRLTTMPTAVAMAKGSLSARAPLSGVMISVSADVRDTTAGVPHASDFQRGQPERFVRPGCQRHVGRGQQPRDRVPVVDETGEVDRKPGGLSFQPGAQRALADDDQSGVDAGMAQRPERVDAAVDALFHRQPAAVDQQDLLRCGPALPHQVRVSARVKCLQIHTQWDGDGVRRADPVELFAREPRGAHDGVVVGGRAPIGEVRELLRGPMRKYLSHKAIQALVGYHHRPGAVFAAPRSQ